MPKKIVLFGMLVVLGLVNLVAQKASNETSVAVISIKANNGGSAISLRLPLVELDEDLLVWKFDDGNTQLTITAKDEEITEWRLNYKGRPYVCDITFSSGRLEFEEADASSTITFLINTNVSGVTMSVPTAYIILKGSYIYFAE